MNKKINSLQAVTFIIIPIISTFIGIGIDNIVEKSGVDSYMSPVIAFLLGIPLFLLILYIYNYNKDKTIGEKIIELYGKILGNIINIILILVFFTLGSIIIYSLCNFITSQFLSETPILIVAGLFVAISIYLVSKGIETISRVGLILSFLCILLFIIGASFLVPEVNLDNLKPVLVHGIGKPFNSAIGIVSVNILPTMILLIIPKNNIVNQKQYNKYAIVTYIISLVITFTFIFMTLSSLGIYLTSSYQYPEYIVLKKINILNFINRIENLISIQWVYGIFIYLTYIIYYIKTSIKKDFKNNISTYIIGILLLLSIFIFKNNTIYNSFCYHYLRYVTLTILPIIIITSILIFIKKRKIQPQQKNKELIN